MHILCIVVHMYHQLSNALPSFLSEDNDDDVIQKRKKPQKNWDRRRSQFWHFYKCITTSVLVLFIFILTKKKRSAYNEYISVFYGEGVRSVCLSVTAHKNFSKLYMYVCNVYLLVQFALLILSASQHMGTYTNAAQLSSTSLWSSYSCKL